MTEIRIAPGEKKSQSGFTGSEQRALGKRLMQDGTSRPKRLPWGVKKVERDLRSTRNITGFRQEMHRRWVQKCHMAQEGQLPCYVCSREAKQERRAGIR